MTDVSQYQTREINKYLQNAIDELRLSQVMGVCATYCMGLPSFTFGMILLNDVEFWRDGNIFVFVLMSFLCLCVPDHVCVESA